MNKSLFEITRNIISYACDLSLFVIQLRKTQPFFKCFKKRYNKTRKKVASLIYAMYKTNAIFKILFIFAGVLVILENITYLIPPKPTPEPPSVTIFTPPPKSTPISSPTNLDDLEQKYLSDITPIIPNKESFFFNTCDGFNDIQVDEVKYPKGIVIKASDQDDSKYRDRDEESINIRLEKKYVWMDFTVGIDKSSLYDFDKYGPGCICRIVFKAIDSDQSDEKKNEDRVLYETDNITYIDKYYGNADLTDVDILRITAYWEYDVSPTKDNSLKLAIVDPILYLKEPENKTGAPQDADSTP